MLLYFKALHLVGVVTWFAGLFYLVRMFVYHTEAFDRPEPERSILIKQFNLMQWRVYKIICNPAMMLTWIFGIGMIFLYGTEWLAASSWLHIKLLLVLLLTGYHLSCKRLILRLEQGKNTMTAFQFRLFNEVPTLFLISIILLAVLKNGLNFLMAFLGILIFGVVLFLIAKMYKRHREKS